MVHEAEQDRTRGTRWAVVVLLVGTTLCLGCFGGCRHESTSTSAPTFTDLAIKNTVPKTPKGPEGSNKQTGSAEATAAVTIEQRDQLDAFLAEGKKEEAVNNLLARAQAALQGKNFDAALRDLERLRSQYPDDPYVLMRVQYLQARVAHRQNDAKARKTAMDGMLKSMERLQQDPRFQEAHREGRAAQDVVKQSIQRGGDNYANP